MKKLALLIVLSIFLLPEIAKANELINVGQIIGNDVPVFNEVGEQISVLNMNGKLVAYKDSAIPELVSIHIGEENTYINRQFIQQVSQEAPSVNKDSLGTVKSIFPFTIFEKTSKVSRLLLTEGASCETC